MKPEPIEVTFTGEIVSNNLGKMFDELIRQDGSREITMTFDSPEFKQRMEWYAQGFQLWREFFETDKGPFLGGIRWCFFCGEIEEKHTADCVYIRAKKLIDEADGVEL